MKNAAVEHFLSVVAQVAAALPPVAILVVVARMQGLEAAGLFAVVAGLSAATFSAATWGFRPAIVIDRFETNSAQTYLVARLVALVIAALIVTAVSFSLRVEQVLVTGLIAYKVCDGLLDLNFAFAQVLAGTNKAIRAFAMQHTAKLLLLAVGFGVAAGFGFESMSLAFALAGVVAAVIALSVMIRSVHDSSAARVSFAMVYAVFRDSAWFALAVAACALVTSAPRMSLAVLYSGDAIGVFGTSLSVATLFGMIFHTAWVRHLPGLATGAGQRREAVHFLVEIGLLAAVAGVVSWTVLPHVVGWLFDFTNAEQISMTRQVLVASVIFFAGMAACNLFKVSGRAWMETVSYLLALVVAVAAAVLSEAFRDLRILLVAGGILMLLMAAFAAAVPGASNREAGAGER